MQVPGFTEIDLVSHSGNCASGDYCYSLNLTDIHTGWTETRAVLGKGQEGVRQALEEIRQALPFPLRGIDSDNGSEFINDHLYRYCRSRAIQFTRGRPYKKDDNAHIEQKNWTHVRRLLGYLRYDSPAAREAINDLYRHELCLFQNLYMPSVKLQKKVRIGSRLRRVYEPPQTPFQRVCAHRRRIRNGSLNSNVLRQTLDPFQLSATIQAKLEGILRLSTEAVRPANPLPARDAKGRLAAAEGAKAAARDRDCLAGQHRRTAGGMREHSVPPARRQAVDSGRPAARNAARNRRETAGAALWK